MWECLCVVMTTFISIFNVLMLILYATPEYCLYIGIHEFVIAFSSTEVTVQDLELLELQGWVLVSVLEIGLLLLTQLLVRDSTLVSHLLHKHFFNHGKFLSMTVFIILSLLVVMISGVTANS